MRKPLALVVAVAVTLVSAGAAQAAPSPTGARVLKVQQVSADFYLPTDSDQRWDWLAVRVTRKLDIQTSGVVDQQAIVYKGVCRGPSGPDSDCLARGHLAKVVKFDADAEMERVFLVLRDRKYTHRLYVARNEQGMQYPTLYSSTDCARADAFTHAWSAHARGTLFGETVVTKRDPDGFPERLLQSVYGEACP